MEEKHKIEWFRMWIDLIKWTIVGVAAVTSFMMIRPREQERMDMNLKLDIHKAYLEATDTENVDLWQRKLNLLKAIVEENDEKMQIFIRREQDRLDKIKKEQKRQLEARQKLEEAERLLAQKTLELDELKDMYEKHVDAPPKQRTEIRENTKEVVESIQQLAKEKEKAQKQLAETETRLKEEGLSGQWECAVCGYLHKGAAPPDICPVCGATRDQFFERGVNPPVYQYQMR